MVDEVANSALGFDARGAQEGAARFAASGEAIIGEAKKVEGALKGVGASAAQMADEFAPATTRIGAETKAMGRSFEALAGRLDPLGREVRRAQADFDALAKVAAGTGVRVAEAAALMGAAQGRLTAAVQAQANAARTADPALRDFGGEMSRAAAAADALKSSIHPVSAAYLAQAASLSKLDSLAKLGLITDQQRAVAADQETAAFRRKIAELDGTAQAERNAAQAAKEAATAEAQLAAQTKAFIAVADPAAAATAHLAEQRAVADKLLAAGKITTEQHTAGLKAFARQTDGVTRSGAAASNMMRQFGIQSFDVFSSLSAGAPVMTVFIQQGAQIAQVAAAQGGALAALGQVARSAFSAMVSPIGLAVAGLATLGAGIAVVASKAGQMADETRALSVSIQAVGRDADLSAKSLQGYVSALARQGVAREDANAIANAASRSGLSQGAIGQVLALVPDAAVALGIDAKAAAEQLTEAARGSYDAIKKLDDALGFLSVKERDHIRRMTEQGDAAGAAGIAMDRFRARVDGLREQSLPPMESAFERLGNSWSDFIGRVASSGPVVAMMERLRAAAENLGTMLSNESPADLTIKLTEAQARVMESRRMVESRKGSGFFGGVIDADRQQLRVAEAELAAIQKRVDGISQSAARAGTNMQEVFGPSQTQSDRSANSLNEMSAALQRQNDVLKVAPHLRDAVRAKQEAMIAAVKAGMTATDAATYAQRAYDTAIATTTASIEAYQSKAAQSVAEEIAGLNRLKDARDASAISAAELANEVDQATLSLRQSLNDPGSRAHVAEIKAEIEELKKLIPIRAQARAGSVVNQAIIGVETEATAQKRLTASYDGTSRSLVRARNANQAYAAVVKSMRPDQEGFNEAVTRYAAALDESTDSAAALQHAEQSVQAVSDMLGAAFDRLGQGLVDAFLSGRDAAVNFGSVAKAIASSLISDFAKLAIISPLRNMVFGGSAPTFGAAFSALGSGGAAAQSTSGGGMMGNLSNVSSIAGLSDALGITSIKETLLGWGNSIGLTGNGGLLGGLNSLLSTTVFTGPTGSLAASAGAEFGIGAAASAGAPVSLGSLLGGAGAGFAIGSIGGGLLQNSMGKTGPAPTIGAGVGAVGGALIGSIFGPAGALLGGILGGTVGGGAGGLIGPKKASSFSSTGLGISATGGLDIGKTVSQIADTTAELAQLQQQVGQINQLLAASGAVITSLGGVSQIGQNTPGKFQDPSKAAGIDDAFSGLRFSAPGNDTLNRAISGRSFGAVADLQGVIQEVTTFVDQVVPALKKLGQPNQFGIGAIASGLDEIKTQFDAAIATAQRLGYAESDLVAAREQALTVATANAQQVLNGIDSGLSQRLLAATAAVTGKSTDALTAAMSAFDAAAAGQRKQFDAELLTLLGDQAKTHESYTSRMAALETALGEERLAIVKSYNDKIAETQMGIQRGIEERVFRLSGNTASGQLNLFDTNAATEIETLRKSLTDLGSTSQHIANTISVLTAVQAAERQAFLDNLGAQWQDMRAGLLSREAAVANDNTPLQLQLFDTKATAEVDALRKQIIALGASGSAVTDTLARLVAVQGLERQAIIDQAAAIETANQNAAAGTASGVIRSIAEYARGLQFGSESPLSATAQLDAATRKFNAVSGAAAAGDFASAQQLTGFAETLRTAARNVFGSGVGYVDVIRRITDALEPISTMAPERLITSVMTTELRSQTTTLSADLMELRSVLIQVRDSIRAGSGAPPASRAA